MKAAAGSCEKTVFMLRNKRLKMWSGRVSCSAAEQGGYAASLVFVNLLCNLESEILDGDALKTETNDQ